MDRRDAIKTMSAAAAVGILSASSFADAAKPAEVGKKSRVKVGLIGCSGRGIGAVDNMLTAAKGAVEIVAIADLFPDRL